MQDFEKLGAFYLGKRYSLAESKCLDELLLYDSKDLTTHAVCVGMTGSGKTGLCLSLLEEAAIDGIPAIAIDPKGDLGNLLLTFPQLRGEDFRPWIDEAEAERKGITADDYARQTAELWRDGLAQWGQSSERIARFRDAVDLSIYTPGSSAGLPVSVLRSFAAPSETVREDADAMRDRVTSATSGVLSLLGIEADPVRSREHILISNILDHGWRRGQDLDLPALIHAIQSPAFQKVGILDLESFFPAKDRVGLAMQLNNLLASPAFAGWMEGEPLDVQRLLYTAEGQPRLSILSIAHLSETERMFFVTMLLNEVLTWVRGQAGTSSLRALLYMDEVFGYFPPVANPPSKQPMLTLLKQARAYGLGIVLATQNPVDLDYKGLSNTGTWFLGRLQTERDKARVLEGLEGASAEAGATFDRQQMEETLAGLGSRVFLMNNVHEDQPVVFHSRWALSYLRGPLTRLQLQQLTKEKQPTRASDAEPSPSPVPPPVSPPTSPVDRSTPRPVVPTEAAELFLDLRSSSPSAAGSEPLLRPALLGKCQLHFVRVSYKVDAWRACCLLQPVDELLPNPIWREARLVDENAWRELDTAPPDARYPNLPDDLLRARNYRSWAKQLKDHVYQTQTATVWKCSELKQYSNIDESEGDFRIRLQHLAREKRDQTVDKLRDKYRSKLARLRDQIQRAQQAVDREQSEAGRESLDTAISVGGSLLGALFGRKLASRTNVRRASSSMRRVSRTARQRDDVERAQQKLRSLHHELQDLEAEFQSERGRLEASYHPHALRLERLTLRPRKADIDVQALHLAWLIE